MRTRDFRRPVAVPEKLRMPAGRRFLRISPDPRLAPTGVVRKPEDPILSTQRISRWGYPIASTQRIGEGDLEENGDFQGVKTAAPSV